MTFNRIKNLVDEWGLERTGLRSVWCRGCVEHGYSHTFHVCPRERIENDELVEMFAIRDMAPWTLIRMPYSACMDLFFTDPTDAVFARLML